ncbi:MAG: DUF2892 domain-containing protein [Dehalococcoidia bacterium]
MSAIAGIMNTMAGRAIRVLLGLVLIYVGLSMVGGTVGTVIAVVGILPILLGLSGRCLTEFLPGGRG